MYIAPSFCHAAAAAVDIAARGDSAGAGAGSAGGRSGLHSRGSLLEGFIFLALLLQKYNY
jgi:hypothetical protein